MKSNSAPKVSLIWLGCFLLSYTWFLALPLYERQSKWWAAWLFLGIGLNAAALRGVELGRAPKTFYVLAIGSVIFSALVPFPFSIGAMILTFGLVCSLFMSKVALARAVAAGAALGGALLIIQSLAWPFYAHLAARFHKLNLFLPLVSGLLNLLGLRSTYDQEQLLIQTSSGVLPLYLTWESLNAFLLLNFCLVGLTLSVLGMLPRSRLLRFVGLVAGYGVCRYFVLLFICASLQTADVFWVRSWILISFLPLPLLLMRLFPLTIDRQGLASAPSGLTWRAAALGGAGVFGVFCLTAALTFDDPGERKPGRVLFDEGRSKWERMDKPYDTEWYGEHSGYNYYSLGAYLGRYYHVDIKRERLTPELLKNYDVLVLKTPTEPYDQSEVEAIVKFVERGGGAWLVGDHTNVFGMGTYLNPVASRFGFAFKPDATYELTTDSFSLFQPGEIHLRRHPAVNRMPFYLFATSCSLDAPLRSESVILGHNLKGIKADYSQHGFFPKDPHSKTAIEYGLMLQSAARKYGDGRVLLYADSTCFSNFSMFMTGKPELALNSIDWLNRRNRFHHATTVLLLLAAGSLAFAAKIAQTQGRPRTLVISSAAILLGVPLALLASRAANDRSYAHPQPHAPYPSLVFEYDRSNYYLPIRDWRHNVPSDMRTFLVWTQRLGLFPTVGLSFDEALRDGDVVVIINPSKEFTDEQVASFVRFIERGGKALVMDDPRNIDTSTAHRLLKPFGVGLEYYEIPKGTLVNQDNEALWDGEHFAVVNGGDPQLFVTAPAGQPQPPGAQPAPDAGPQLPKIAAAVGGADRRPVLSVAARGEGMLVVFGCSYMFSGEVMGTTSTVPDARLRTIYEVEYWLFRDLLGLR